MKVLAGIFWFIVIMAFIGYVAENPITLEFLVTAGGIGVMVFIVLFIILIIAAIGAGIDESMIIKEPIKTQTIENKIIVIVNNSDKAEVIKSIANRNDMIELIDVVKER